MTYKATAVPTHLAKSSEEIVDMMAEHVGQEMITTLTNAVGALVRQRITLAAVGGKNVAFWTGGKRFTMDAFDAFGQATTLVHHNA